MLINFLLCALAALTLPVFAPSLHLTFFAPFLLCASRRFSLTKCLTCALLSGFFIDLLSPASPFGFYTLISFLTLLFRPLWTKNFFKDDTIFTLLATLIFVWIWTLLQSLLAPLFRLPITLSFQWIVTDFLLFPIIDLVYTWIILLYRPAHKLAR